MDKLMWRQKLIKQRALRSLYVPFHTSLSIILFLLSFSPACAQTETLTIVELNCENLFDCSHDEGKNDDGFLPDGAHRWTHTRYWRKLNDIGKAILSCSEALPELVALVEIENDSVLYDLTQRSLLRNAGYRYLMTNSSDERGIDVGLLYRPVSFSPLCYDFIEVKPQKNQRPTRDVLYVKGVTQAQDTLHIFVVHAPSRNNGEKETRPYRMAVAQAITAYMASLPDASIVVTGDFNDYATDASLRHLESAGLTNATKYAQGCNGRAHGTYRYQGEWHSIDHVLLSADLAKSVDCTYINDATFLLEPEKKYGGMKPRRTFNGYRYNRGVSDHLPLVVILKKLIQ